MKKSATWYSNLSDVSDQEHEHSTPHEVNKILYLRHFSYHPPPKKNHSLKKNDTFGRYGSIQQIRVRNNLQSKEQSM